MGAVSAIGINLAETVQALREGVSGIGTVRFLKTAHREFPVGEVKVSNASLRHSLHLSEDQMISRSSLLGIMAVREALNGAGLHQERLALVSGTTVGGMDQTEQAYPSQLTDAHILHHDCGSCTNDIADYFDCFDFTATSSTACSSAMNALILGARMIEAGLRDIVVVGGTESLTRFHLNGFKSLMILDEQPCKPFDATRAGLNLGEGAAYLVLEREQSALKRGRRPIAELLGTGNACDAFHQTATSPDGKGAYLAMRQALEEAQLLPTDINYVNAHGTGTLNNDETESAALKRIFGSHMPWVSSTKGLTGHTTSACGSIETVFAILSLQHQFVPVNAGWATPDPACVIPYMGQLLDGPLKYALCNSFGFGGNDSSIIVGTYGK